MQFPNQPESFLQAVLESFVDGVLVLTEAQEIIYANTTVQKICAELKPVQTDALPEELQRLCEALVESRELYPHQSIALESELITPTTTYRLQAQWLVLAAMEHPCILLRLQDQNQSVQGLAIAEAQRWGLTARETEVWLLRRAGCLRKEIATTLFIALDTVKKHLKNIESKRQAALDEDDWQMQAS